MSLTKSNSRATLERADVGGRENTYFLVVEEGEWEHVVRLMVGCDVPHSEAIDILNAMWDSRLSAEDIRSRDARDDTPPVHVHDDSRPEGRDVDRSVQRKRGQVRSKNVSAQERATQLAVKAATTRKTVVKVRKRQR